MQSDHQFWKKSIRLDGYNYASDGAYFVTICTHNKTSIFGHIQERAMHLNTEGRIAEERWFALPEHFSNISLDAFVVMPNHIHGIIIIGDGYERSDMACHVATGERRFSKPIAGSLSAIIGSYKSAVTNAIHTTRNDPTGIIWQSRFFDRIIRGDTEMARIRRYIELNPERWESYDAYSL